MRRFILVSVASILLSTSVCLARTWSVPTAECPTIQAGIDSAGIGDTVLVAAGMYTGEGNRNLDFGGIDLVLLSEEGPQLTVIDCEGGGNRGFYFHSGEGAAAVVRGFTVRSGSGDYGGGMHCSSSSPTLVNCSFTENYAGYVGGGGVYCEESSPTFIDCTFLRNSASEPRHGGGGGGMYFRNCAVTVSGCTFAGNVAWSFLGGAGGAIYCEYSSMTVSDCTFHGNSAGGVGGGIYCGSSSSAMMENTIIAYSSSGEAISGTDVALTCCDIFGNSGGDWVGGIEGQLGINGNFSACPSFCHAEGGDFTLCDESPCLPGNHPDGYDCGLIGAWGQGCACGSSVTEPTSWGGIKAIYR
jgi:predicted outer membrane repeat protein